jgi:hypothetical protein
LDCTEEDIEECQKLVEDKIEQKVIPFMLQSFEMAQKQINAT